MGTLSAMRDPEAIAEEAPDLAAEYFDVNSKKLADEARGNPEALRDAARIVKERTPERRTWLSAEHLAFALITIAYDLLRQEGQTAEG